MCAAATGIENRNAHPVCYLCQRERWWDFLLLFCFGTRTTLQNPIVNQNFLLILISNWVSQLANNGRRQMKNRKKAKERKEKKKFFASPFFARVFNNPDSSTGHEPSIRRFPAPSPVSFLVPLPVRSTGRGSELRTGSMAMARAS